MDIPNFRVNFPEFADSTIYPTTQIFFWASLAERMLNAKRWGDTYVQGVNLYVAHEITIATTNLKTASMGGTPGLFSGTPNSKTVGNVTISYDANTTAEKDAGYWNLTVYGKQFYRLTRLFGAGCLQL